MIIHSGIVFLSQAANVSDYMPRKRAATAIWYGLSYTVIAHSGNLEVWHPESGIGWGRNPGNQAQFKEIMTYTSAQLRGLIQLAVLGYLTHNG